MTTDLERAQLTFMEPDDYVVGGDTRTAAPSLPELPARGKSHRSRSTGTC